MSQSIEAGGASQTAAGVAHSAAAPVTKHLLSKSELARILSVSERTIENWLKQKKIPRLQLSARLQRFSLQKVEAALARYEIKEVGAR
jgi:excisionase family DNA binding protein